MMTKYFILCMSVGFLTLGCKTTTGSDAKVVSVAANPVQNIEKALEDFAAAKQVPFRDYDDPEGRKEWVARKRILESISQDIVAVNADIALKYIASFKDFMLKEREGKALAYPDFISGGRPSGLYDFQKPIMGVIQDMEVAIKAKSEGTFLVGFGASFPVVGFQASHSKSLFKGLTAIPCAYGKEDRNRMIVSPEVIVISYQKSQKNGKWHHSLQLKLENIAQKAWESSYYSEPNRSSSASKPEDAKIEEVSLMFLATDNQKYPKVETKASVKDGRVTLNFLSDQPISEYGFLYLDLITNAQFMPDPSGETRYKFQLGMTGNIGENLWAILGKKIDTKK